MKPKRRDIGQYRKNKGLVSLRNSQNLKGSNPMTKSLKIGTLANLRKSGKESELTKASPSMQARRTKTNNLRKMAAKNRRVRGLLSVQSEEESLILSQELRKKNDLLRSEIIERQKNLGKHKDDTIRSVSMVIGEEDKHPMRKKINSNKKRISQKMQSSLEKKDFIHKKLGNMKNAKGTRSGKKGLMKINGPHFKTQNMKSKKNTNTLPRKSSTSNNKIRLINIRKKTKLMKTMPLNQKKTSQPRGAKRTSGAGKLLNKGRNSNSRKIKENSKRSINNIYKRARSSKQNKQDVGTIYNNKKIKNKYLTEQNPKIKIKRNPHGSMRSKGLEKKQIEDFENIYELKKGNFEEF